MYDVDAPRSVPLELEFPRFDGHFSVCEGECLSCRERGTRIDAILSVRVFYDCQLNMLRKWMGHSSMATTAIYANAMGAEEMEIAKRMWR